MVNALRLRPRALDTLCFGTAMPGDPCLLKSERKILYF
jgi:hypothetical protein